MTDPKYKAFTALDPFFDIVQEGLAGQVDLYTLARRRGKALTVWCSGVRWP
jgi:hypothetical protein